MVSSCTEAEELPSYRQACVQLLRPLTRALTSLRRPVLAILFSQYCRIPLVTSLNSDTFCDWRSTKNIPTSHESMPATPPPPLPCKRSQNTNPVPLLSGTRGTNRGPSCNTTAECKARLTRGRSFSNFSTASPVAFPLEYA